MAMPLSEDGRQHQRYAVDVAVALETAVGTVNGRGKNVSRGGLCAHAPEALAPGTPVTARMALVFDTATTSDPLVLKARIVWCTPLDDEFQLGAAFLPLTAKQVEFLDIFLRYIEEGRALRRGQEDPEVADPFES
jgi:hypothetical protein